MGRLKPQQGKAKPAYAGWEGSADPGRMDTVTRRGARQAS